MKAKERHELKENELAEWFTSLPDWLNKNRNTVIYVATALIILGIILFWYRYQKFVIEPGRYQRFTETLTQLSKDKPVILQSVAQQSDIASTRLRELENRLRELTNTLNNPRAIAIAYIELAKTLRTEIHYQLYAPDPARLSEQINNAKQAYTSALTELQSLSKDKQTPAEPTLEAIAIFGIGICEEELGAFQEAANRYKQLIENPAYRYTPTFEEAKRRLFIMSDFEKPVVFQIPPLVKPITIPIVDFNKPLSAADANLLKLLKTIKEANSPNSPVIQVK